jgi:hypothetical protein
VPNARVYLYAIVFVSTSAYRRKSWLKFSEFVTIIFLFCASFLVARWLLFEAI